MYTSNTFAFRESKNTISFCGLGLDDFTFIKKKKTYVGTDWSTFMSCRIRLFNIQGIKTGSRSTIEMEKDVTNLE